MPRKAAEMSPDEMQAALLLKRTKPNKRLQTVKNPQRMAYPGIYKDPREIAAEAAARVAPEDPALKQIFGVTREDLYQMGKGRKGNLPGTLPGAAAKPQGAEAAANVMTKRNAQRLLDVMGESEKHHALVQGMDPWYIMDPMFKRMAELLGPEKAAEEYKHMNTLMGMASPGSEVTTEIPRGSAAYYLMKQGRFPEFVQHAGKMGEHQPEDIRGVPGHAYHKTAQAGPMQAYIERGQMDMSSPKVPMYIEASGVPETGFQTATPVGDAHWSRAVGLADTRNWQTSKGKPSVPKASVSNAEMSALAPWWREQVAGKLGLESVPAQARAWGAFSPQTGVTTPIGSPKLELIAQAIMQTAQRLGVSPQTARDLVLTGKARMGKAKGGEVRTTEPDHLGVPGVTHTAPGEAMDLSQVGANEAPNMDIKEYTLPTGGVDMNPQQPGMQLLPPELAQMMQQQQAQQAQQAQMQQSQQQGQQPPSNILALTRQGQAMNAMRPPQQPAGGAQQPAGQMPQAGQPVMRAGGGEVAAPAPRPSYDPVYTHEVRNARTGETVGRYQSLNNARRAVDRYDNLHGGYVHTIHKIPQRGGQAKYR